MLGLSPARAALLLAGAASACVPAYTCEDDGQCNLLGAGVCVDGRCVYDDAGASLATTPGVVETIGGPTSDPPVTTEGPTGEGTAAATTSDEHVETTDPTPDGCVPFVKPLAQPGKATGLAVAADGTFYVAGVAAGPETETDFQLLLGEFQADGEPGWALKELAPTQNLSDADDDTDVWVRLFLHDDELTAVYTRRAIGDDPGAALKHGPFIHRLDRDGGTISVSEDLMSTGRSLRGAVMPAADRLYLAGEDDEDVWFERASRDGDAWAALWTEPIVPFSGTFKDPAITQAIAPLPGDTSVLVAGTVEVGMDPTYSAFIRGLDPDAGNETCSCKRPGTGILAMAAGDTGVYVGGFLQIGVGATAHSELWVAHLSANCPANCAEKWRAKDAGTATNSYFGRAELIQDAIHALVPLASGGVVVAGLRDHKPFVARYDGVTGVPKWEMKGPEIEALGSAAALALSVDADSKCVTVVGSRSYTNYETRTWWIGRAPLK